MGAPTRWKDSPDAPVGMRELIHSAKRSRPMDDKSFERGAARVAKISVVPAAAAIGVWAKLAAAGVAVGLAAVGTIAVTHGPDAQKFESDRTAPATARAPIAPSVAAPVVTTEPPMAPEGAATAPPSDAQGSKAAASPKPAMVTGKPVETARVVPEPPAPEPTPSATTTEVTPRPPSTLHDELTLLETAKRELARDPTSALATLAQHRARFPDGSLSAERDLIELDALRRAGRVQDARDRARAWLARDPVGLHSARVRQILSALE